MIGKGKAVVGKAAALLKDETFGLIDDAREAKTPIKEGVSTFLKKSVPLTPVKRAAGKLSNGAATEPAGEEHSTERESPAQGNREYFRRLIEETNKRACSSSSSGRASKGA